MSTTSKKLNKLSKELKIFQDLLKAKILTSLEHEASSANKMEPAPKVAPASPAQQSIDASLSQKEAEDPPAAQVRPISPDVADILATHHADQSISDLHNLHKKVHNDIANRHPKRTVKDLDRVEDAIRARAKELQPQQYRAPSRTYSEEEIAQKRAERNQRLESNQPLETDRRKQEISRPQIKSKLSPMQEKALAAEQKQIAEYTGSKERSPTKPGLSFHLVEEPAWTTVGKDTTVPSQSTHLVYLDGDPIGRADVNHYREFKASPGRPGPADAGEAHAKMVLPKHGHLKREIEGALMRHLKSNDFKDQLKRYQNPIREIERKRVEAAKPVSGTMNQPSPKEIKEDREAMAEAGYTPKLSASQTYAGYAPKGDIREFSREKAISDQKTSPVPDRPKQQEKHKMSPAGQMMLREAQERGGGPSVDDHIKSALNSPDEFVRNSIMQSLLQSDKPRHLMHLIEHPSVDEQTKEKAKQKIIAALESKSA